MTTPFTPEWRARIRELAETNDPFWMGAAWAIHTLDHHQQTEPTEAEEPQ